MMSFSFRARAGRLSFVIFFCPYIDPVSHVFVQKSDPLGKRPSTLAVVDVCIYMDMG